MGLAVTADDRWTSAPLRSVTWRVEYVVDGAQRSQAFTLSRRVPDDATPFEVDDHYAGDTGPGFVEALPSDLTDEQLEEAISTSDFGTPTIHRT